MPKLDAIKPTDWRTVLYLQGVESDLLGTDTSYYYTELANEWRKLYDIAGNPQGFRESVKACPTDIDFFLDLIDATDKDPNIADNYVGFFNDIIYECFSSDEKFPKFSGFVGGDFCQNMYVRYIKKYILCG